MVTIIAAWVPGEVVTADSEKEFYNHLLKIIENEPLNNVITVLDNFNARIGDNSHKSNSQIIGNTNYHYKTNDNGKRLVSICQEIIWDNYNLVSCKPVRSNGLGNIHTGQKHSYTTYW